MKVGIMQPYIFPYIGYFQLINFVDTFVVYDNIQFTKKGWINRNRILLNGKDELFTLPIKRDSDYLNINERDLSNSWQNDKIKILNKFKSAYQKAPYFKLVYQLIEDCLNYRDYNLFNFLYNALELTCSYIGIDSDIQISSKIQANHELKSEERVLSICAALKATEYINPIGGFELYKKDVFANKNINIYFLKSNLSPYSQFNNQFIPALSIIDVLMFNDAKSVQDILNDFRLL